MDRGLFQREAAQEIGVSEATLYNWETGRVNQPETRHLPKILAFLGGDPREEPEDLPGRCRWRREALGLSQRTLARRLGLDPTSVMRVETGRRIGRRLRGKVEEFVRIVES